MSSAQVLRKQGHLEAGKKKLEEFRRKKAAEKPKKAVSTLQLHVSDGIPHEKHLSEEEPVFLKDSNGVGVSDDLTESPLEPQYILATNNIQESDVYNGDLNSRYMNTNLYVLNNHDNSSSILEHSYLIGDEDKDNAASVGSDKPGNANFKSLNKMDDNGPSTQIASRIEDNLLAPHISSNQEVYNVSNHLSDNGLEYYPSSHKNNPEKELSFGNSGMSTDSANKFMPLKALLKEKFEISGQLGKIQTSSPYRGFVLSTTNTTNPVFGGAQKISELSDLRETKFSGSTARTGVVDHSSQQASDYMYSDHSSNAQSLLKHAPVSPSASGRRSRPSFLDSIQISKGPLASPPLFGGSKADSSGSKVYPIDSLASLVSQKSVNSVIPPGDVAGLFTMENKHDLFSRKQNEDFSALEQHIEDLTLEKFSLQRALETSRALAESLDSENSTLTETFNHQGSNVNQLKIDLEKLQEEIKAQLVELEAVKIEYANTQLECNAADERAKLLASEVIELEEKALRLRSNELKLERQLENSQAEVMSSRKKMSSLEKDRQDLLSTINALQEEKKLLRAKVLKAAAASGKSNYANKIANYKKDVSTSTEDIDMDITSGAPSTNNYDTASLTDDSRASPFPHENILPSLDGLPLVIPSDQMRMVQNISTLIAELALEKDQLLKDLSAELSQRSKLSELNKELTRKLESQTQKLELLMSQRTAKDNILERRPDLRAVHENITYADEGDEVVERVLGWIMKLFPGGPSRRQTSKHI